MPQYSAGQVMLESGLLHQSQMMPINRVIDVRIDGNIPRANINNMNRGKPLETRPVINYVPVNVSFDMYKSDNALEQMLGLINSTGVAMLISDTNPLTATYGIRSMQVYYAPTTSSSYNGMWDLKSGILTSYSLQGSISEAMRQNIGMQFLDMSGSFNTTSRVSANYPSAIVKPENINLTGIQFTGYGLTGVTIQSFSLGINFSRASVMLMNSNIPRERPLMDVNATLQIQGFFEGLNGSLTGLSQYNVGNPTYESIQLILYPACTTTSPSIVSIKNPYLENFSFNGQAGDFSTFSMSFSMPLGSNPTEIADGSTLSLQ